MKPISRGSKAGFTLVELIVVIAILAILAGIAIPVYSGYIKKANQAADEQLLAAVNTAYGAACLENNVDPRAVSASAALTNGSITAVSPYNESFQRYFAGNGDSQFKYYKSLGYDPANGVFVGDGGTFFYTVTINGKEVTVAVDAEAYEAIINSAFGDSEIMTMADLMNMVAGTTSIVANMQIDYTDPENVLSRAIANDDYSYFLLKTAGALDGMDENEARMLAGLYAIYSNPNYFTTGGPNQAGAAALQAFMSENSLDAAGFQALFESFSAASGMVSAFETEAGKGSEGSNFNENMLVLYAARQTGENFDVSSALTTIKQYSGDNTTGIFGIMTDGVAHDSSASIPGENFANAALGYALATAYGERNGLLSDSCDARAVMGTDAFKAYLDSEECAADINGYLSCMMLMNENMDSGSIDAAYVAQYGFNSNDIIEALSTVFDQNP